MDHFQCQMVPHKYINDFIGMSAWNSNSLTTTVWICSFWILCKLNKRPRNYLKLCVKLSPFLISFFSIASSINSPIFYLKLKKKKNTYKPSKIIWTWMVPVLRNTPTHRCICTYMCVSSHPSHIALCNRAKAFTAEHAHVKLQLHDFPNAVTCCQKVLGTSS